MSQIKIVSIYNQPPSLDPEFYRDNTFIFSHYRPEQGLNWLQKLSPPCLAAITKIRVIIHAVYNPGPAHHWLTNEPPEGPLWVKFFETLTERATGLKHLQIYFDAERFARHWGGGNDVKLLEALGKMRTLSVFELDGFFGRNWPSYLQEKTGCSVWRPDEHEDWYMKELKTFQSLTSF